VTALVKYEAAKHALAAAKAVDEVKKIHDVSAAMKAYARQAKDKQLEIDASEIRIRAERRLGEMIRAQKEGPGLADGGDAMRARYSKGTEVDTRPTLAQVGIDKKLSSRSQAIASIPEDDFEETLAEHREGQQAVTAATMDKLARKGKEAQQRANNKVSDAAQYADMAIRQLQRIRDDDPNAQTEMKRVSNWIAERMRDL
jgi:hypothetical protein